MSGLRHAERPDQTLFSKGESWIFGANIPGRAHGYVLFRWLGNYRKALEEARF